MRDLEFYRTRAGREYYEKTLPALVEQLGRLAEALEKLTERMQSGSSRA